MKKKFCKYPENLFQRKDSLIEDISSEIETIRWNINSPDTSLSEKRECQKKLDASEKTLKCLNSIEGEYIPKF